MRLLYSSLLESVRTYVRTHGLCLQDVVSVLHNLCLRHGWSWLALLPFRALWEQRKNRSVIRCLACEQRKVRLCLRTKGKVDRNRCKHARLLNKKEEEDACTETCTRTHRRPGTLIGGARGCACASCAVRVMSALMPCLAIEQTATQIHQTLLSVAPTLRPVRRGRERFGAREQTRKLSAGESHTPPKTCMIHHQPQTGRPGRAERDIIYIISLCQCAIAMLATRDSLLPPCSVHAL